MKTLKFYCFKSSIIASLCIILAYNRILCAQDNIWQNTLQKDYISDVQTTSWGITASEYDNRTWMNPPPYNGVFLSNNFGEPDSWTQLGLDTRGITDLFFFDNKLYASSYYVRENQAGIFVMENPNSGWSYIGKGHSTNKVSRDDATIYMGTFSHGLWVSKDNGTNWEQKIGTGYFGPKILEIYSSPKITIVSTSEPKTYKTTDNGETWDEIQSLSGISIGSIYITDNTVFAGTTSLGTQNDGLYRSTNLGETWQKLEAFGNRAAGGITFYNGVLYAAGSDQSTGKQLIFKSLDYGNTWEPAQLVTKYSNSKVRKLDWAFSSESCILAAVSNEGIYKYTPGSEYSQTQFLNLPWNEPESQNFVDKITSFFDHQYPLLRYPYFREPPSESETTLNYLGFKDKRPLIYYSSHEGTDFALPLGTEITAPADGYASFYKCNGCGNAIIIKHQNGYQTYYFHLQQDELIATETQEEIWVTQGTIIGKVGMTGMTTGPHLHFAVTKNLDEALIDIKPDGRVDPFGWQVETYADPWKSFSWVDATGGHLGSPSYYLWNIPNEGQIQTITTTSPDATFTLDNKSIKFDSLYEEAPFTVKLQNYLKPVLSETQTGLKYIPNTSVLITLTNPVGAGISFLQNSAELNFDISQNSLNNINEQTLKVYFWDSVEQLWEPLPTIVDLVEKKLTARTDHFSNYAVFGNKLDDLAPKTQILINGSTITADTWNINPPEISFFVSDPNNSSILNTYFSTDGGNNWETYLEPLILDKEGIIDILYRSEDTTGNLESTRNQVIKIDILNKWKKKLVIKESEFEIN